MQRFVICFTIILLFCACHSKTGSGYTHRILKAKDVVKDVYRIVGAYKLRANDNNLDRIEIPVEFLEIADHSLKQENGQMILKYKSRYAKKVNAFTIIYADDKEVVLSGVYSTRNGKTTYYNFLLKRQ